jgi:hypothetical protein
MQTFSDRLRESVAVYRRLQSPIDGGWTEDRTADAPRSIVNTTEVLTILRAARVPHDDPAVQRGLGFLAQNVFVHPRVRSDQGLDGRGRKTRYLAWGLRGLVLWQEARQDPRWRPAQEHCVRWLARNEQLRRIDDAGELWVGGAWKEHERNEHPSLLSTQMAVEALDRVAYGATTVEAARAMAGRARAEVARMAQDSAQSAWWPQVPGERQPSAAATALAVLCLARGDASQRGLAKRGVRWLMGHVSRWVSTPEGDANAHGSNWSHMTFSLGVRAVLTPHSGVDATGAPLRPVIDYLDDLWLPRSGEWSHGKPGARPSPTGSCAVVLAHQALRDSWPFDASMHILQRRSPRRTVARRPAGFVLKLDARSTATVYDLTGDEVLTRRLGPRAGLLLSVLAVRHQTSDGERLATSSVESDELARLLGVLPDTVRTTVARLNRALISAALERDHHIGDLIQEFAVPGSRTRRWHVNVDEVVVVDEVVQAVGRLTAGAQSALVSADAV